MNKITHDQLIDIIKQLLDRGEIVIGKIRVNDGKNIASYTALSACPPEHREGYRRALETGRDVHLRNIVYDPVFISSVNSASAATLE